MFLRKYHVLVFRDGRSGSRNIRLRGWLFPLACVLGTVLIAGNVWLARSWLANRQLEANLADARRVIEEQRSQFVNLAGRLAAVSQDLQRVQRFDSKLRLMMNMEKDPADVGEEIGDFSRVYLPLYRQELAARKMRDFLASLSGSVRLEEVRQQDLLRALRKNRDALASLPSIWPVTGFISSGFGGRPSPFNPSGFQFHKGLDISCRQNTPIVAPAQGEVILAARDGAYGNSVEINHGGGIVTKYGHLERWAVQPGQWVKRGEVLGYVGMTGRATGPHLHYEVRLNGVPVNPMRYILE